jgi:hypothetical protein
MNAMRIRMVVVLLMMVLGAQAQLNSASLKLGVGYGRDFPGVSGPGAQAILQLPVSRRIEAGLGLKHVSMSGYPRTPETKEFTKATALDFELYFLPLVSEQHVIRIGLGYSFSFYNMKRLYPELDKNGVLIAWGQQAQKGTSKGMTVAAEYAYQLREGLALGVRGSIFQAYDGAIYVGPFISLGL